MGRCWQKITAYLDLLEKICDSHQKQREMLDEATKRINDLIEENLKLKKENEDLKWENETLAVYADKYVGAEE